MEDRNITYDKMCIRDRASNGGIYPVKFESDPETEIDDMTVKIKGIVDEAEEFHGDMQEIDPETHMLNTVRTALQGLFLDGCLLYTSRCV